jgi:hypothetical protein
VRPAGPAGKRGHAVRIDSDRCHTWGYQARVSTRRRQPWGKGARIRSKFFADRKHGGTRAAAAAALQWIRDQVGTR